MAYLYLKALHIIFVVTWFSGLFYIVRLFIYHVEALGKSAAESDVLVPQYQLMARRLWYAITWPSAVLTLVLGASLLYYYIPHVPVWLWIKLGFVLGLFLYQLACHKIFLELQHGKIRFTGQQLRVWNEVATVFLFSIVFLVILKNAMDMLWGLLGFFGLMAILMAAIYAYKRFRKDK